MYWYLRHRCSEPGWWKHLVRFPPDIKLCNIYLNNASNLYHFNQVKKVEKRHQNTTSNRLSRSRFELHLSHYKNHFFLLIIIWTISSHKLRPKIVSILRERTKLSKKSQNRNVCSLSNTKISLELIFDDARQQQQCFWHFVIKIKR